MLVASFLACLAVFVMIGGLSAFKSKRTSADYLTARGTVAPWLAALSAVATANSGYMFIGMIGYTYQVGLSSIWLLVGWIAGDFIASFVTHSPLRETTRLRDAHSYAGVLARWQGKDFRAFRMIAGILIVVLLGAYAAAQLTAGGKALFSIFGWDYNIGAIVGSAIVLVYCLAGGIRASIWTDAAQSFVMIIAMITLCVASVSKAGGVGLFLEDVASVQDGFLSLWPQDLIIGGALGVSIFIFSWLCAGFGVSGQPHIMIRFMALKDTGSMKSVRLWYYGWYISFALLTICVGLGARLLLPNEGAFDAELALPTLALVLLPDVWVGIVLAGLFAATMSTADSLILSCTAAFTRDICTTESRNTTKLVTAFITIIALVIALTGTKSVFALVIVAWAALSCAFAPILAVLALGGVLSQRTMIWMVLSGVITVCIWRYLNISVNISEVPAGFMASLITYVIAHYASKKDAHA